MKKESREEFETKCKEENIRFLIIYLTIGFFILFVAIIYFVKLLIDLLAHI